MQPLAVLVCALGGEGGGVLSEWLYEAAVLAGYPAQCTSVPGVAQRTGATTYYIEVFPRLASELRGRRPIFSLNPVPGGLDLLVSSELLETLRQVGNGMSSPQRTQVISSTARALTVAEKMQMSDGRADSAALASTLQVHCRAADLLDLRRAGPALGHGHQRGAVGRHRRPAACCPCRAPGMKKPFAIQAKAWMPACAALLWPLKP